MSLKVDLKKAKKYQHVGNYTPRHDAVNIVTGNTIFLDDFKLPGMIYGKAKKSPYPHANIVSIDVDKAKALPGVYAVLTYKDVPQDWMTGMPPTKLILDKTVRCVGDNVALVAADTLEICDQAMDLIDVEYELLEPVYDVVDAIKDGAPQMYERFKNNVWEPGCPLFSLDPIHDVQKGDVEKGFEECDFVTEGDASYEAMPSPLAPEPPGAIVSFDSPTHCDAWVTTQGPNYVKGINQVRMPGIDMDVHAFNVGGSYGNKQTCQMQVMNATVLAKATGKPVKFFLSKEEHLLTYDMRIGARMHAKIGMLKDGTVHAIQGLWLLDTGIASDAAQGQVGVGLGEMQLALAKCPNWDFDAQVVSTTHCMNGIVRGFGGQELKSCMLPLVNKCAKEAGLDPVDVFKKNFVQDGDTYRWRDGLWWTARDVDYVEAITRTAEMFNWKDRWKGWNIPTRIEGSKIYGVGVGIHGNADVGEDNSEAYVRIDASGKVVVQISIVECGMGQREALQKMAGQIFQVPMTSVTITPPDTLVNPHEFTTGGSRGTRTMGTAVVRAAEDCKRQLIEMAAEKFNYEVDNLDTEDGFVYQKNNPKHRWSWAEILPKAYAITGFGRYLEDFQIPSCFVIFVEVEVDTETGIVKMIDVAGGSDVGQIIDPKALEMQYHGGFGSAGTDTAIFEESVLDKSTGRLLTGNLIDYKWRTFNEFPPYKTLTLESNFSTGNGAVGLGEITGSPGPAAIMMAISNAIGKDYCHYPATPASILAALGKAKNTDMDPNTPSTLTAGMKG